MLRWLYALAENAFLRERVASLEEELAELTRRLYSEIDGNRLREDALISRLALSATTPAQALPPIPSRADFKIRPEEPQEEEEPEEPTIRYGVDERWVQQRVDDFMKAAEPYGGYADPEALADEIRSNPDKYLVN